MSLRPDDRIVIPLAPFPREQTPRSIYRDVDESCDRDSTRHLRFAEQVVVTW